MSKAIFFFFLAWLFPVFEGAAQPQSAPRGFPVSRVIAETATLRESPSDTSAPVMNVFRGAMFPIDGQNGDWYRVVTRTGDRAWIPKGMLQPVEEMVPDRPAANEFTFEAKGGKEPARPFQTLEERLAAMESRLSKLEEAIKGMQNPQRSARE